MEDVESYDLVLHVTELKLSVKFPCRLTLQHAGKPVSPEIQSNGSNVFPLNREINLKEDKKKDAAEINVNLVTDKGGNIMAGIIKVNLKEVASQEGQTLTIPLQKCLDPYATCLLTVKTVKMSRSRTRRGTLGEDWKSKVNEGRYQSKSQAPVLDIRNFKGRPKYNDAESSFVHKRVNINTSNTPTMGQLKEKALSTVGFRAVNASFDRQQFASRFKHFGRNQNEESKTVIPSKYRDMDQSLKASLQSTQKTLKLEILKYKTKFDESERNIEEKTKQIKTLKDQISEMNRQLTEKHFLIEQLNSKNSHITKLQETNKSMSKQIHEERNKLIDLERQLEEEKNSNFTQMSRFREDNDKKEHELQKSLYEKKEEIKEVIEENQYKINQINKMKGIIEDLETNLQNKTYEYEKLYSHEKTEHHKTKILLEQKINDLTNEHKKLADKNQQIVQVLVKSEEENKKMQNKIMILESTLLEQQHKLKDEQQAKERQTMDRKKLQKTQEELTQKIKYMLKDQAAKQKQFQELQNQLNELSNSSKRKTAELLEKNKAFNAKIQQLENKVNILSAQEEKLKRNLDLSQKEAKNLQENEKIVIKNSKQKDDKILQMEKELTELESKINMKESLGKKEAEYKAIQLEKITARVSELEKSYERQKQVSEDRRLQLLKSQNKVRMLEENIARLNDQIKDLKTNQIKKEDEWMDTIKQLKDELKAAETKEAEYNKEIHSAEIQKINLKNEISKLEKIVESSNEKNQRLKKKQLELQNIIKTYANDLELRNQEIVELQAAYKTLQNDHKALQADKNKTQKITSIIKEQKVTAVGDINKLKKEIERREQKEQEYLEQIKGLKEEIVRWDLKWNATTKQFDKFKSTMSETIKNSLSMKAAFNSIDSITTGLENSRGSMSRSRVRTPYDYTVNLDGNEARYTEAIQNYARESQQAIMSLTDQLKKIKKQKQTLEKDHQQLNNKYRAYEEDTQKRIDDLTTEIEKLSSQNAADIDEYEEKTMNLERQVKKRDKSINELIEDIQELRAIQSNEHSAHEAGTAQLLAKIHSLKSKIADHEAKEENTTTMFVNLEEKLSNLQSENTELIHQNQVLSEQLIKKQKDCSNKADDIEELTLEVESLKKTKNDLFTELLALKENFTIEKQHLRHTAAQLKEEETKNSQLRVFNAEILKEKQILIKKEAELSQKINGLEDKVQMLMIDNAEKSEQLLKRENIINEYRESSKDLHLQNNTHQSTITDLKIELEREKEKLKDRERKITERDQEIESLIAQNKKNASKFQEQISKLKQQNEQLTDTLRREQTAASTKINDMQFEIKKLKDAEKKLNDDNIVLEEQIFFEKQMHSLANSRADEVQQDVTKLTIEIDKLNNALNELNEELREKDESLFALSGKLYASENRVESKEEECRSRMEKLDLDWRYKLEEICEQYQNKLQLLERQKSYVRSDVEGAGEVVQKLEHEKVQLRQELEREREVWQSKLKKAQEQKLVSLIQKNRQIEKIRQVFEQLQQKLKRKDYQLKTMEEDKKKAEQKLRQLRADVDKIEEKKIQMVAAFERQIDQHKRKQGQLKRFKQALKNNQWTIQRQIKKGVQNCAKSLVNIASEESKEEVMHLMRNLETSVAKLACPNIDEI